MDLLNHFHKAFLFFILALLSFVVDFRNFCLLTFTAGGDSCGISVQADTPQER